MGILSYLLKKQKKKAIESNPYNYNPTKVFSELSDVTSELWQDFLYGQNQAVDLFAAYKRFVKHLNEQYYDIDFERHVIPFQSTYCDFSLTSGECMYLYALIDPPSSDSSIIYIHPVYIALDESCNKVICIDKNNYQSLGLSLTVHEREYCNKLKNYIGNSIKPLVDSTSKLIFYAAGNKYPLPINSKLCTAYHRYIFDLPQLDKSIETKGWNRVASAPNLRRYISTSDNPIVPAGIQFLDVPILDWICYASIAIPSYSIDKLLSSATQEEHVSIMDLIVQKYGQQMKIYIEQVICDMNGKLFRDSVKSGLKME